MDAPEDDQDVKLQRASHDLLADLQSSIDPFLWKTTPSGKRKIRRRVRVRETDRLVALLEPFQENPQLLDPSLQTLVPPLADAFLACLQSKPSSFLQPYSQLMTTSRAICKLIYTFCKVRGEKVIVRFVNTEARHLELLLSAIEVRSREDETRPESAETWEWEERYVALLWLSQLLYAPFDLASISSASQSFSQDPLEATANGSEIPGLRWPPNVPSIAFRAIPLAIHYLSSSGKERDAARVLLVRVAMRKDMQELGVLHALVQWAIFRLQPSSEIANSTYYYIGTLSFLAGILKSSMGTADVDKYLRSIFDTIQSICSPENVFFQAINASPVVRKTGINILRNISVLLLRSSGISGSAEMVEWTIGYLLDSLGDSATPVRIATSKSLSVITLKLAPDMAEQVVEEILNSLRKDIMGSSSSGSQQLDVSTVNPLEWHGLVLTLSQLLYRRSPPPSQLGQVIGALIDGVNFEQRSTSGSSVGTNVRDAANLGIWALARRYTTNELQAIRLTLLDNSSERVLQKLAAALVVSASLDPAGNIRRGSSAALQELIGRHPDTVVEGIRLVQTVEYSSVALRSKAMQEVAVHAAGLDGIYSQSLLVGLESWRGIGDPDPSARRVAAITFGSVMTRDVMLGDEKVWDSFRGRISSIERRLSSLQQRQVDERHGLILCLASTMNSLECEFKKNKRKRSPPDSAVHHTNAIRDLTTLVVSILEDANTSVYRRPELIAEAVSALLVAFYPMIYVCNYVEHYRILFLANELLERWLHRSESDVVGAASEAASGLFRMLSDPQRDELVGTWIRTISEDQGSRTGQDIGVLSALFLVFPIARSSQNRIIETVHIRWKSDRDIDSRVAILRYLGETKAIGSHLENFIEIVAEGLDDYTTDTRGDIGSLVRTEALKVAGLIWKYLPSMDGGGIDIFNRLFPKTLRLAAEKLDKVRSEGQNSLANALISSEKSTRFAHYSCSSKEYFRFLLDLSAEDLVVNMKFQIHWHEDLLEGFVSSADTGSEDIVRASRAALAEFCESGGNDESLNVICEALYMLMKKNIKNDRILVPAMEVMGFLFDYQIMQRSATNWRGLYALIQNAHYQTGNIRKLEAAVKLYGGLLGVYPAASQKLTSMLLHKFPKVRNGAADTIFATTGAGKGVNWVKAKQEDLERLRRSLAA